MCCMKSFKNIKQILKFKFTNSVNEFTLKYSNACDFQILKIS